MSRPAGSSPHSTQRTLNVGLIGAGNISGQYLQTLKRLADLNLVAVADLDLNRVRQWPRRVALWACA